MSFQRIEPVFFCSENDTVGIHEERSVESGQKKKAVDFTFFGDPNSIDEGGRRMSSLVGECVMLLTSMLEEQNIDYNYDTFALKSIPL